MCEDFEREPFDLLPPKTLEDGSVLRVRMHPEDCNWIEVIKGGLMAPYTESELETIGGGSSEAGLKVVVEAFGGDDFSAIAGDLKPFFDLLHQ